MSNKNFHTMTNDDIKDMAIAKGLMKEGEHLVRGDIIKLLQENEPKEEPKKKKKKDKLYRVIFHNQDIPGGTRPVVIGINGVLYNFPREEEVPVPESALKAIENSAGTRTEKDASGRRIKKRFNRFAYSVLGEVEKEGSEQA